MVTGSSWPFFCSARGSCAFDLPLISCCRDQSIQSKPAPTGRPVFPAGAAAERMGAVNSAGWSCHGSRRHSGHCYAYSEIVLRSSVPSRIWCEPTQMALICFHWCKWGIQVWNKAVASWSAWELRQKSLDKGNSFGQSNACHTDEP